MSSCRKKRSGAENRKKKAEESAKKDELLKKIPKISSFMVNSPNLSSSFCDKQLPSSSCTDNSVEAHEHVMKSVKVVEIRNATDTSGDNNISIEVKSELEDKKSISNLNNKKIMFNLDNDPAMWKCDDETRDFVAIHGIKQNIHEIELESSKKIYPDKIRYVSRDLFVRKLKNGEVRPRTWLRFSKSKGAVFCVACLLFSKTSSSFTEGFQDWKNSSARVQQHENSNNHKNSVNDLKIRGNIKGRLDNQLIEQVNEEVNYWKNVLRRVVATVKFLAVRGLSFRGHCEKIKNLHNGNFLGLIELISQFDPFLEEHLQRYADKGSGITSYLSKTVYEELILLLHSEVLQNIIDEVKTAKYFGISVDSTPDIAHVDQLTFILRYVQNNGEAVERFICFVANTGHKAKQLEESILNVLTQHQLNIEDCRGQCYDNASNMSGIYSGLQARILALNPLAAHVPCGAHSLNLVGKCTAGSIPEVTDFFDSLQALYNFFSVSTHRWEILISNLNRNLKSLCVTRWSARHDACRTLVEEWDGVIKSLEFIANEKTENQSTRSEAEGLLNKIRKLETAFLAITWNTILNRFNAVNLKLQNVNIDITNILQLYNSLVEFLGELRNDTCHFKNYENKARNLSNMENYSYDSKRKKIRKVHFDETQSGEFQPENGSHYFRIRIFNPILDHLTVELSRRTKAYTQLNDSFAFLSRLTELKSNEIAQSVNNLVKKYPNDLEDALQEECIHLSGYLSSIIEKQKAFSFLELSTILRENELQEVYPNVDIAIRIFLSIPATNCSGERSFSTLKRVKSYLRSNIGQERLNALALLTIEADILEKMDCEEIITKFANTKARKKWIK